MNKISIHFSGAHFTIALITLLFLFSCNRRTKLVTINPEISRYIESYTSGVISKDASIRIRLATHAGTTHEMGQTDKSLFKFSPEISGTTTWVDAQTVEFKPKKPMKPGELYTVSFRLGRVVDVPDEFKDFIFNVEILRPSFLLKEDGLRSARQHGNMFLPGSIETADIEDTSSVEQILSARHGKDNLKILWEHTPGSKIHKYRIEGITRGSVDDSLVLSWNGKPLQSKNQGKKDILVPASSHFMVLDVRAVNDDGQYISVLFSDIIKADQQLTGMITVMNEAQPAYTVNGSEVKVYLSGTPDGDYTVNINPGIINDQNQKIEQAFVSSISFQTRKPSVEIAGRGNILPHEGKLTLPFTAVNLNAVDVTIIKIYENNVPRFLQDNDMDGAYRLRQVAIPLVQKTLRLDNDKTLDLHRPQRFSIDIDKYLQTEPGAIYNITIGFRPEYSLYGGCTAQEGDLNEDQNSGREFDDDDSPDDHGDFWSQYDNYYPFGYDWEHRDNPCYNAYYNKSRFASRNIFASNIGIIAQRGAGNQLQVVATNLLTTLPLVGAEVTVLDYQQQVVGTGNTDKNGFATPQVTAKPYLVIITAGAEKGYLKVDDGNNLPLSRFDIDGQEIQKGIKGFIFGERGVWRPGDSLYISFIEQRDGSGLPADHPIEFELYNPMGQLFKRIVQKNDHEGYNVFKTATEESSPTGNWRAKVTVGGAVFEKTLRVETVMPNRLKIDVSFGGDTLLGRDRKNEGVISSAWLFGAPASGLKATVDLSLSKGVQGFPGYKGFVFENPLATAETRTVRVFDGRLNESGNADFKATINTGGNTGGMMKANVLTKVFEPGGTFSIRNFSFPYSPYSSYVGISVPKGKEMYDFLATGKIHTAKIVDVDATGKLVGGDRSLVVSFYKIQWRWWWDRSDNDFSTFSQNKYNKLIKTQTVDLKNGKADWNFSVPENEWGRYLILVKDNESGHTTGEIVYMDDPWWQSRSGTDDPTAASMLSFTSDKEVYHPGEKITLTIPGSNVGKGLISIQSGSRVLKNWWIDTKAGQTQVSFEAEKDWVPNIYVSVSLLQPYEQTANDLPIRMYGVIPIRIESAATVLTPVITMPDIIRPEQDVSVTISEKNNQSMWYTIAIVDDGLLDLTNYKTPDPHQYFFAKEALSVKTWDMYDNVIGAWGNNIERILTIGGDQGAAGPLQPKSANRFPPVVKFLGPFKLQRGSQTQHFSLPQYSGSVRVMVVGFSEGASGSAQKTVQVKKPLMLLATLPRTLSPGESILLPVTVFSTEKNIRNAEVHVQSNDLLTVTSAGVQRVTFDQPGEKTIFFGVQVGKKTGIGKVDLTAASGKERAAYKTELNIKNANPFVTRVVQETIAGGKNWSQDIEAVGNPSNSESVIEISSIPDIGLKRRLDFLIDYPHGCAEQVTSRVFAQLYLNQLTDLNPAQKTKTEQNIKAGIASLQNYQTVDGGFAYWAGDRNSDDWSSSYVGHFLLLAKAAGYYVPDQMMDRWKSFQRGKANSWEPSTRQFYGADLAQAYRLFTLALSNSAELGAMNRLKAFQYISPEAKWRLAAAYQLGGYTSVANSLISGLATDFAKRQTPGFTFGSDLRDEAMVLETLTLMGKKSKAEPLLFKIASQLSQNNWYSTQTTAYALLAIQEFVGKNPGGEKITASVRVNGKDTTVSTGRVIARIPAGYKNATAGVTVRNTGKNILFISIVTKGQPLTGERVGLVSNPGLLQMNVTYMTQDKKPLDITSLRQGTNFIAKVTVTNPGNRSTYERMALTQIVPSGWEILNTRLFDAAGEFVSSPLQHQDIRDDRVYTYFDLARNTTKTFYLQLTAAYTGKYFLPAVYCSSMYDEEIQASEEGRWINVLPAMKEEIQ